MSRTGDNGFDAAVVDRENHAVALVQVKAHPVESFPESECLSHTC